MNIYEMLPLQEVHLLPSPHQGLTETDSCCSWKFYSNSRKLDQVEERISTTDRHSTPEKRELSTDNFLQNIKACKSKKTVPVLSSLSSDDSDEPSFELLKSRHLQHKVDKRLSDLSHFSWQGGEAHSRGPVR